MKHPLLIAMLTPQAAPETRGLRIMRLVWMALCASLAGAVLGLQVLLALLGPKGALVAAALCLVGATTHAQSLAVDGPPPVIDYREFYTTVIQDWWGLSSRGVFDRAFKPLALLRT